MSSEDDDFQASLMDLARQKDDEPEGLMSNHNNVANTAAVLTE
jgi:hypothetical protein